MELDINNIRIGQRYRKKLGDIKALATSMEKLGLLHPIVVTPDHQLIAGQRRLEACRLLGWSTVPAREINLSSLIEGQADENMLRKNFTPSEKVAIGQALEPIERAEANKRMLAGKPSENSTEGQAMDKVAAAVGMSRPTYEKAKEVVEAAEIEPEKYGKYQEAMDKSGKVAGPYKHMKRAQQAEEIAKEPPPFPAGPFRVIVVDPPWQYKNRAEDHTHRGAIPYPSMSIEEIKDLPIAELAEDDCILWLWTTNAHLREAFDVLEAWGFEYKTLLTWVKNKMGVGDWLRGKTEHSLMSIRGKPIVTLTNQTTVLIAPAREHSQKPDEFYELVQALCPGSKVELFARTERSGWTSHGNETSRFS